MSKSNVLSERSESKDKYTVHILKFSNNSLYNGQTSNLIQRLKDHKTKTTKASKFSKENGEIELVYQEKFPSLLHAMRRERQFKGWTRAKKEALIVGDIILLKSL